VSTGHLAVCQDCANLLMGKGNKRECPICKAKITKAVRIFKT
jgi:rubrerythrin